MNDLNIYLQIKPLQTSLFAFYQVAINFKIAFKDPSMISCLSRKEINTDEWPIKSIKASEYIFVDKCVTKYSNNVTLFSIKSHAFH